MDFLDSLADIINDDLDNIDIFDDELMHYGTPRHSGRYPWGSGENPYQHSGDFFSRVRELKKEGMTEKEIADYFEITTTDL